MLMHQWAWEFLRRNKDYQALVQPYLAGNEQYDRLPPKVEPYYEEKKLVAMLPIYDFALWEEISQRFWLLGPINPGLPGQLFPLDYWHREFVAVGGMMMKLVDGQPAPYPPVVMTIRRRPAEDIPLHEQRLLIEEQLDMLFGPLPKSAGGRPPSTLERKLRVYDLWEREHHSKGGQLQRLEIWQKAGGGASGDPGGAAQDDYDEARALIAGGYKKFLARPMLTMASGQVPPDAPSYLQKLYIVPRPRQRG